MMTVKRKPKKTSLSNSYCMSTENIAIKKLPDNGKKIVKTLHRATLVNVNEEIDEDHVAIKIVNLDNQYDISEEDLWLCPREVLIHVDKSVWPLICAVPQPTERIFLLRNKELCNEFTKLQVGSIVRVLNDDQYSDAVIRYIGPVSKKGPGTFFGVELLESDKGDCDGKYHSTRYFSCPPNRGMFLAIHQIMPKTYYPSQINPQSKSVHQLRDEYERKHTNQYPEEKMNKTGKCECDKNALKNVDRVVYLSDESHLNGMLLQPQENSINTKFDERIGYNDIKCLQPSHVINTSEYNHFSTDVIKENGDLINFSNSSIKPNRANSDLIFKTSSLISDDVEGSSESEGNSYIYDTPESGSGEDSFVVGSLVEVTVNDEPMYGVIRWIGSIPGLKKSEKVAGIEMEEERPDLGDGRLNGERYFRCNPSRSIFVRLNECRHDSRFQETPHSSSTRRNEDFGAEESPIIPGFVAPISQEEDISELCGKFKGIQGHHNSCYLDATLFSMFTFTSVFDTLLYRPATPDDIVDYEEVQRVLREEIVNPLRQNLYVRADRVMKLRKLMERLSSVSGLTTDEKDPEEFMTSLVAQILRADPFLKLSSGQEAYHYQLFVEKDDSLTLPTVQQLFEQSFLSSDIKLKEVPACLIIQMPRFGKSFKMYPRILPSQLLDVTDVIEDSPRQCTVCGNLAIFECKQCFNQCDVGLPSISFCENCLDKAHTHEKRRTHRWRKLSVPPEFEQLKEHCIVPRLYMQLFAVVCIETSHYVTFVKCGTSETAPWCFFDSMADRKGEQNGYNIPEVVACPDLPHWLSDNAHLLPQMEKHLPEHAKRLLCDAYMW
ncbi:hypothetical protein O3M35_005228 [Rhynocoris fuscipes]|uniref:ubiquitinyl hydrolase 1 n=1 Tax=Rhynocoris fuscipes TaxID=488301 RepID=A0AAW1DK69_9HEMI